MIFKIRNTAVLVLLAVLMNACQKSESSLEEKGIVSLKVSAATEEFDNLSSNNNGLNRAAVKSNAKQDYLYLEDIPFNDDYVIEALLTTAAINSDSQNRTLTKASSGNKAAIVQTPIQRVFKFRLVVYDKDGNYMEDKFYTINSSGAVNLEDGGEFTLTSGQYYFVAYSNNTNTLAAVNLKGTKINTAFPVDAKEDFMLFNSGLVNLSSTNNNLNIIFKHKLSSFTVVLDASYTNGYKFTAVGNSSIASTRSAATANFQTGIISASGNSNTVPLLFPQLNEAIVTSTPVIVNNNINNGRLSIGAITIGPLRKDVASIVENLAISPGKNYTLVLNFKPNVRLDENLDVAINNSIYPAVKINNKIWMRYNLGANTALNPDVAAKGLVGNYYQWGASIDVGDADMVGANSSRNWRSTNPNATAWGNLKTGNDPCPTGWKVPTKEDWDDLIANTTALSSDNIGNSWRTNNTANGSAFSNAKVLRSKRDYNVKLTFPVAGYFDGSSKALTDRSLRGVYWTASIVNNPANTSIRTIFTDADNGASTGFGTGNRNFALNVRCIRQ